MCFGSHNLVVAQVEEFDDSRTNLVSTGHLCRIDILAVQQWLTPFVEKDTREAKRAKETISKSFSTFVVMDSELSPDHHILNFPNHNPESALSNFAACQF